MVQMKSINSSLLWLLNYCKAERQECLISYYMEQL